MLWNKRPGTKNGPQYSALRRLPIRPDLYTPENIKDFTDADQLPYQRKDGLIYDASITGDIIDAMREEIRVMCIDTHDELREAWGSLIAHSEDGIMPARALERFNDVALFSHKKTRELQRLLDKRRETGPDQQMRVLRVSERLNTLAAIFRRSYSKANNLAKKGRQHE